MTTGEVSDEEVHRANEEARQLYKLGDDIRAAGVQMGELIASEAIVICEPDPERTERMVSTVRFHDKNRMALSLDTYVKVIQFLGNFDATPLMTNHLLFDMYDQAILETLDAHGALRDLT